MPSQIETIEWEHFAQPEWNTSHSVATALSTVMAATDAESCASAYDNLLYALGNNHAGTYYPILLAVMPVLETIINSGQPWPQRAALSALDDLYGSFHPEPGYEHVNLPEGDTLDLESAFRRTVHGLRDALEQISETGNPNASLATDLLSLLNEDESGVPVAR